MHLFDELKDIFGNLTLLVSGNFLTYMKSLGYVLYSKKQSWVIKDVQHLFKKGFIFSEFYGPFVILFFFHDFQIIENSDVSRLDFLFG